MPETTGSVTRLQSIAAILADGYLRLRKASRPSDHNCGHLADTSTLRALIPVAINRRSSDVSTEASERANHGSS